MEHKERECRSLNIIVKLGRPEGISANNVSKNKKSNSSVIKEPKTISGGPVPKLFTLFHIEIESCTGSHKIRVLKKEDSVHQTFYLLTQV